MPYCDVADDVALYYEDFGAGSPVVFTNAGNLTHKMWMGQVAALAPAFRTITYDIRGTGFSAKPRLGYTAESAAAELCALVERLDLGPVTMAAHGIGTHIMLLAAAMRPDLVTAIVLVSGGPWFSGERDGVTAGLAGEFLAFLASRAAEGVSYADICEEMIQTWLFARSPSAGVVHPCSNRRWRGRRSCSLHSRQACATLIIASGFRGSHVLRWSFMAATTASNCMKAQSISHAACRMRAS